MIELRTQGATLQEIGDEFALTRERVRQLLKKHGGPTTAVVRAAQEARTRAAEEDRAAHVGNAIRATLNEGGPMSAEAVARAAALELDEVSRFWPRDLEHMRLWRGHSDSRWSDDEVLAAIREAALYEFPLTANAYSNLVSVGQIQGPSLPRIGQRFGSWTAACDAASVVPGQTMRGNYESRWSDDDLLQIVKQYLVDPDAPNSANRFDEWKRAHVPDGPSFQTLRNRFGTWTEVKRQALAAGDAQE
jgi:hypothetical protein